MRAATVRSDVHHGCRGRRFPSERSRIIMTVTTGKPKRLAKNTICIGE